MSPKTIDVASKSIAEIKNLLDVSGADKRVELISLLEQDPRAGIRAIVKSYHSELARMEAKRAAYSELMKYERKLYDQGFTMVAGVDEAGRGALAGPLVAAAVILPSDARLYGLKDSKQLTPEQRDYLYGRIVETAVAWKAVRIEHHDIDLNGIQWANLRALELAVLGLCPAPNYVLSDAFTLRTLEIPHLAIIKGDSLSVSIAAASVIAKVTRDRIMLAYHKDYPGYGFDQHKGYGTPLHISALDKHGISPIHRRYFAPVAEHEQLKFL